MKSTIVIRSDVGLSILIIVAILVLIGIGNSIAKSNKGEFLETATLLLSQVQLIFA